MTTGIIGGTATVTPTAVGDATGYAVDLSSLPSSIIDAGRNPFSVSGAGVGTGQPFALLDIATLTRATVPAISGRSGDTPDATVRINTQSESIVWTITYMQDAPPPQNNTYDIACTPASPAISTTTPPRPSDCSVSFSALRVDDRTHTVTVSDISDIEGNLELINGGLNYADYESGNDTSRTVYLDTLHPRLASDDAFVIPTNPTGNLVWQVTFSEEVTGFGQANIELTGAPLSNLTITPLSGIGTTFTMTVIPSVTDREIIDLAIIQPEDVSTGAFDASNNPLQVDIRSSIRVERALEVIEEIIEKARSHYVDSSPSLSSRLTRVVPTRISSTTTVPTPTPSPTTTTATADELETNFSASGTSDSMYASIGMDIGNHSFAASMSGGHQSYEYSGVFSIAGLPSIPSITDLPSFYPDWISGFLPSSDDLTGIEVWVQSTYSVTEETNVSDSSTLFFHMGVDMPMEHGGVLGALLQIDSTGQESAPFQVQGIDAVSSGRFHGLDVWTVLHGTIRFDHQL